MPAPFESREVPSYPAAKLRILVHPLFVTSMDYGSRKTLFVPGSPANEAARARSMFFYNALHHFTPRKADEFLLFMPQVEVGEDPSDPLVQEKYRDKDIHMEQWPELYWSLLRKSDCPDNVLLAPDVVGNLQMQKSDVLNPLKTRGVAITQNTEIILGGEWLNACLWGVAEPLLELPYINKLNIDLDVTTMDGRQAEAGPNAIRTESDFIRFLRDSHYQVSLSGRIATVSKHSH